jgi:hypothetical protein
MRRALTVGLVSVGLAAVLALGCRDGAPKANGDCVERLMWRGAEYAGHPHRPAMTEQLGRTTTIACDEPFEEVSIYRIPDVHPSVAVGVRRDRPGGRRRFLGLGPGYIVQSPRHPFHRVVYESDELPNAYDGQVCRRPRAVDARVIRTPMGDERWLTVRAVAPDDRRYVQGRGVRGVLSIDAGTVIDGLDRGGIPYVKSGQRLRLRLRACRGGPQAEEGLRGLAWLVVVGMSSASRG